jgi:2-haloacid dehalogenase
MTGIDRRAFLNVLAGAGAVAVAGSARTVSGAPKSQIQAVAFDAFTTFDPRSLAAVAEQLFPGRGGELATTWRTRQFEYQWLHALSGHYADFWAATEGALVFAASLLKLELTADKRDTLMQALLELKPWPDAAAALRSLRERGIRLALLSNVSPTMLETWIANAGFGNLYEHVLTTHRIKTYKPDPRAYQMGIDAFGLERAQIAFAAFGGWDAAGAKWFGYPTFWVNRLSLPVEGLGVMPDGSGSGLAELIEFVTA